jgi:tetratricopeptide (TPR) repeat protein
MPRLFNAAIITVGLIVGGVSGSVAETGGKNDTVKIDTLAGAYLAARTAESDNDLAKAVTYYEKAVSLDPANEQLMQSLMLALIMNGNLEKALPYAEKLKSSPDSERFARIILAVNAINTKDYGKARNLLTLTVRSDLDRLIAEIMTAWSIAGSGKASDALTYLDIVKGPSWFDLFIAYHKALIAGSAGMKDKAAEYYAQAMDMHEDGRTVPDTYLRVIEARTRFLARTGQIEKAREVLKEADAFAPGQPSVVALKALLDQNKEPKPLVSSAREGAAEIFLDIATAINRPGSGSFVQYYLRLADALDPGYGPILVQMAMYAEQNGQSEQAIGFYKKVPDNSPLKRISELQMGLNLADIGKKEEAEKMLLELIRKQPSDRRAYLALGGVYSSEKDYQKSADLYDKAVAAIGTPSQEDWNIFYQRGIAHERLKEWARAEPNFLKALELQPDQPQVLNYLGYSWVDMNIHLEDGLKLIRQAVDLRPRDGYIVDSLGWAYYRLGRYDDAVEELERAVALKPGDSVINDHLGDAYWRAGRKLEATYQWRQARDMDPDPELAATIEEKLAKGLPPVNGDSIADKPGDAGSNGMGKPAAGSGDKT